MEKELQYRSTIKSRPYLYLETKSLGELISQGLNECEIKEQVINQNIFQVKSEARKREIASTVINRLKVLDNHLINKINQSDKETSKLIVLYSILKTDRLFFEFMNEVFQEKRNYQDPFLTDSDIYTFFETKRQQSATVAKWTEYTFYKLQQVYIRILYEAGLLKNQKGNREIEIPIIDPDIIEHIKKNDGAKYLEAILGG
ncbi:DUF1819 family protein [Virgibacillus pantothenticus]|uniref:DUF1819 family protein n=1 Tax=Virgibacillus pantothenticus TaxID=1473 RepID=UPI001C24C4CB|nr:DUF1819 family protein [Virgibacillus pantothenticus]MBU8565668.1 DUF1819 family protein [Virgibacillus pantothenticus]MBU8601249.1 DUF1819 family protein [Virgibacillus pantothenticus]MBU8635599.1 DUF1819 family protein [Virgibacillus pantothenticus]MBU8643293.1 DUF1819 family protein [Virgibacillus pantothenticus]MBU8647460.1 DUF1819 family protein [Virgibacillus pantothenticus]